MFPRNFRRPPNRWRNLLATIFLVIIGIGIFQFAFLSIAESLTRYTWAKSLPGFVWVENIIAEKKGIESLQVENRELLTTIQNLESQVRVSDVLLRENIALKGLLGRLPEEEKENLLIAAVLSRPSRFLYDTIVIDAGFDLSVAIGDVVYAGDMSLLGTVEDVRESSSVVKLFSYPERITEVSLADSGEVVSLVGLSLGNFGAKIPRRIPLEVGDDLIYPGIFPHLIGRVGAVESPEGSSFQIVRARLIKNPSDLTSVIVARN